VNKRIDNLIAECTSIYTDYNFEHGSSTVEYFDKEKFAELIVRECIDNVKTWEKDSRNHISYLLKNHYGVEE